MLLFDQGKLCHGCNRKTHFKCLRTYTEQKKDSMKCPTCKHAFDSIEDNLAGNNKHWLTNSKPTKRRFGLFRTRLNIEITISCLQNTLLSTIIQTVRIRWTWYNRRYRTKVDLLHPGENDHTQMTQINLGNFFRTKSIEDNFLYNYLYTQF